MKTAGSALVLLLMILCSRTQSGPILIGDLISRNSEDFIRVHANELKAQAHFASLFSNETFEVLREAIAATGKTN